MKKKLLYLLSFAVMSSIIMPSCGKDGTPGPAGASGANGQDGTNGTNGTNGEDGKDGKDGNANVVSSEWFVISPWAGVSKAFYFIKTAPAVTQGIIDSGVVLAYTKLSGGGNKVRPLPAMIGSGATEYNFNFNLPQVGEIEFTCNLDGSVSNSSTFRYVVIPSSAVESAGLNKEAIKKMDYAEVEATFNLK